MNTLSYKTRSVKKEDLNRQWYVVDADGEVLGRLCTRIATVLRGKHHPEYTPHVDTGDYVIVVNAGKVRFTGNKENVKIYQNYSGYPGGLKELTASEIRARKPERLIEIAVKGMLPKNKLGNAMIKKLFVYAGPEHLHTAQQPKPLV
ncbi:MAG: 50S ribosomal protein L13 [Saprospiraceae bacterium]|nr:50S ribosomal protein L13 [Candidatus Opimibacter skivensis]MBP6680236.1 50S ribosomal protein L13 [Saprospiraceae bacterium]HQW02907.1 50S ribosomal protein L13 [Saprospiraceae bacterium]HQW26975.1 50S ribosomal protein L13 [Saprospiraceae bacterium]